MAQKGSFSTDASSKEKASAPKNRVAAPRARTKHRPPLPWPWASGGLIALLVLPVWAAVVFSERLDWRFIATYLGVISVLTVVFYWSDKRKAQQDQWRIPEGTLHLLELLGGWPAALLAQRTLRHKTKKKSYQVLFWLIIGLHQFLAFEVITNWWLSRSILRIFL